MRYWVFDLDGTLVDSFGHFFDSLKEIFSENGKVFSDELRLASLTESLPAFFEKHLGTEAARPALEKLQRQSNLDAAKIQPFAGTMPFIRALKESGSKIAVWTSRENESAKLILEQTGLSELAEIYVTGTCTVQRKPHLEGLLKIREHFKCELDEITMVGDHEHDMMAAKNAGARAVRASWHSYWPVEKCTHADYQFYHVSDFQQWASSNNNPH